MSDFDRLALFSVYRTEGLSDFVAALIAKDYKIVCDRKTFKYLKDKNYDVYEQTEYFNSILDLKKRGSLCYSSFENVFLFFNSPETFNTLLRRGSLSIALVVVDLFSETSLIRDEAISQEKNLEGIETEKIHLLRVAAKYGSRCLPVVDAKDYQKALDVLESDCFEERLFFIAKAFEVCSSYDRSVLKFLKKREEYPPISETLDFSVEKICDLESGENSHQKAALYGEKTRDPWSILQGKSLNYNDFLNINAGRVLCSRFSNDFNVIAFIRQSNPSSVAVSRNDSLLHVFNSARVSDELSHGSVLLCSNQIISRSVASRIVEYYFAVVVAPQFTSEALEVFNKKRTKLVSIALDFPVHFEVRSNLGAFLVQTPDQLSGPELWRCATIKDPNKLEFEDLELAWIVCAQVKSSAVVIVRGGQTLGIGVGQVSLADAMQFAISKALIVGKNLKGAVLASDHESFSCDCIELAAGYGISAIIQPGTANKNIKTKESADLHGIAMIFSGETHSSH